MFPSRSMLVLMVAVTLAGEVSLPAQSVAQSEDDFNDSMCHAIGGVRETRHYYNYRGTQRGYVIVDCETDAHVIEGGLDKRSSLDSLQQAVFFSILTGKAPVVVIYDTDEQIGKYEHRIAAACAEAGVLFLRLNMKGTSARDALIEALLNKTLN